VPDRSRKWRGEHPHAQISKDLNAIVGSSTYDQLRKNHLEEFKPLFYNVLLNLGTTPLEVSDLPTDERLARYAKGAPDPELEALFFQYGRYLLLSSSRPGVSRQICKGSGITPTIRPGARTITPTSISR